MYLAWAGVSLGDDSAEALHHVTGYFLIQMLGQHLYRCYGSGFFASG